MLRREDKEDAECLREVLLDMRISSWVWGWPRATSGPERVGLWGANGA